MLKKAVDLALGYNRAGESDKILAGIILMAQAIEEHRVTMGRMADAVDKLANNVGVIGCSVSDIKKEICTVVDIYKKS